MMRARPEIALLALALCACQGRSLPAMAISLVTPTAGGDDAPVTLTIVGDRFVPRVETDFSQGQNSTVDEGFTVSLVPGAGDPTLVEVPLTDVHRLSQTQLTATVPAGPARGFYGVRVTDPFGRQASLTEVYRVVHSANALAGFAIVDVGAQRAGVPFMLQVSAVDESGALVDGFVGSVTLQDRSGALSPGQLGPFSLGRARAQVAVAAIIGADTIVADDGAGHTGQSADFSVAPGLAVQAALTGAPDRLDAGACSGRVAVELQDGFGRPAPAASAVAVGVEASPPDRFALFSDTGCTVAMASLSVASGASSAQFSFRARRAGTLLVKTSVQGLPSATRSIQVDALAPAQLDFSTPTPVLKVGGCSAAVTVQVFDSLQNPVAPAEAVTVDLSAQPAGLVAPFADDACTAPLTTLALSAGQASFHVRATSTGTAYLHASAPAPSTLSPGVLPVAVTP